MYQKILVPLDGSKLAESALSHVKNLVKDGAVGEVTLLNVVNVYVPGRAEIPVSLISKGSGRTSSWNPESILQMWNPD